MVAASSSVVGIFFFFFFEKVGPFILCLRFFFEVEISSCNLTALFRPRSVHSGSVS